MVYIKSNNFLKSNIPSQFSNIAYNVENNFYDQIDQYHNQNFLNEDYELHKQFYLFNMSLKRELFEPSIGLIKSYQLEVESQINNDR